MVVADGEGNGVGSLWLGAHSTAHHVLREGMLSVGTEVEASAAGAAAKYRAIAASPAIRSGVKVGVAIFGGRHYVVSVGGMSRRFLRFMYCMCRGIGPLAWCIGRVVVGVEGSLSFGWLERWGIFGMSLGSRNFFSVRKSF